MTLTRGRSAADRLAHNQEVAGSSPAPATSPQGASPNWPAAELTDREPAPANFSEGGLALEWFTAAELASEDLPGLPATVQGINQRAKRECWLSRDRSGRGGGKEFHSSALPSAARSGIAARAIVTRPKPAPVAIVDTSALKDHQRATLEARAAILAEVDRLTNGGIGRTKAIGAVIDLARQQALPSDLQALVAVANARSGKRADAKGGRTLSRASIYNWLKAREQNGVAALAPAAPAESAIPAWAGPLVELYGRPQKPSLSYVMEYELPARLPAGVAMPSYDQARRFFGRLSAIARNQGRMGPRALKAMRAYVSRDASMLWPTAVYSSDGHTFDAEVAHPIHGRPFRPEITTVLDIYTRKAVGWSAALSEATFGVLDAARHSFETSGLCDIWYVDRGKGFNNEAFDAELTGFMARLSVTKERSLPYNSQARGVIERFHQTCWVAAAKTLPTYMGAAMDPEARQSVFKMTRRDIAKIGRSQHLMEWPQFLVWCQEQIDRYNARPHSGLPKIADPSIGKKRHMAPDEAWAEANSRGWQPDLVEGAEADDLFRPYQLRTVRRALVSVFGNEYYHPDLEPWHGREVQVGYDIHDASRVWVRSPDGRLICVAGFEANKRSYFPVTAAQSAHQRRVEGRIRRLDLKRDEVDAELRPNLIVDNAPQALTDEAQALADAAFAVLEAEEAAPSVGPDGRPIFRTDTDLARWLLANPTEATTDDGWLLAEKLRGANFQMLLDCEGISVSDLQSLATKLTEAA